MVEIDKEARRREERLAPICAIGASAGAVEALQRFFERVDEDLGVAYVVIVHLSPHHDSQLSEILKGRTRMPVRQVEDTLRLEPNRVYVIAPDRELVIEGDSVRSRPFSEPRGLRAPIDMFFRSVAAVRGDGMAVVLSGAGSDGAVGITKMKEAGAVVFVQDPADAEFGMMPRTAMATGAADFVEPIERLVERIGEVARSKDSLRRLTEDEAEDDLRRIVSFLHSRTGHSFASYKRATVLRRVTRRMQVTRSDSLAAYGQYLRENPEEAQDLFSDLLISVTAFFRDPAAFEALKREVFPALFDDGDPEAKRRIWSVGCATGEEPYSLAILILEEAERRQVHAAVQIFATDLDEGALATAREGRYPKAIEADVSEERLRRFFVDEGSHYRICKEVRDLVLFAHHSAIKDPPFMRLDLIICRNLLIYLERDLQRQLLALFHYALKPSGFLFLGSAESVDTRPELFAPRDRESRVFAAKPRESNALELLTELPREHRPRLPMDKPAPEHAALPQTPHAAALEALAPPSALVDETQRVLNLSPNAGRFIRPPEGPLSVDLTKIVRPELRVELRRALSRALKEAEPTQTLPAVVSFDGQLRRVAMHVLPAPRPGDERGASQALVLFVDAGVVESEPEGVVAVEPERVRRLEEDLKTTQDRLSASRREHEGAIQELRVANEELQSINEEYRSTAEELETSKEELQSINEELKTVNGELKSKLDAVASAHSDLHNLINATEIGTLFLDSKLRIKMLTPAVEQLFSVTESDVGRPITNFTHRLAYDGLDRDAIRVLRDLTPVATEVQTKEGSWLMMRLRPYRTVEDRIEGVVLSFVDITGRRRTEERLRESEARYRRLFESMDEGYLLAELIRDEDGRVVDHVYADANPASARLLGVDLRNRPLREIQAGLDPLWRGLPERVVATGVPQRAELRAEGLDRWFEMRGTPVDDGRVAILFQDVTDRKRHEADRELMVGELNHRVKNMLSVVQSIASQTSRTTTEVGAFVEAFRLRIQALGRAHDLLTQDHWRGADLRELATAVLESFMGDGERFRLKGPAVRLTPNATVSFAMALHELGTNALKYGALSEPGGRLELSWRLDDNPDAQGRRSFRLVWTEVDGPPVEPPSRAGFGRRMLEKGIGRELDGEVVLDYAPDGVICRMTFPAERMISGGR